jgi:hypothetical protein
MSRRDIAAKRREIAQRYARNYAPRPWKERIVWIMRSEIRRLIWHRSRPMSRFDLDQYIAGLLGPDWELCPTHDLAHRALKLQLTIAERMLLDIRQLPATDVGRHLQREAYAARRRKRQRERIRAVRARYLKMGEAIMQASDLSDRTEGLAFILKMTGKWLDTVTLAESVKDFDAWQRSDGKPMNRAARENKVREHLRVLKAIGDIIEKTVPGKRGGLQKRVVKWHKTQQVAQPDPKPRRSADKHDTSRVSTSVSSQHTTLHAATHVAGQQKMADGSPSSAPSFTTLYPSSDTKH